MRLTYMAVAVAIFIAAAFPVVADIAAGDGLQKVLQTLGQPQGYLRTDGYLVLYYERGKIELLDGYVVTAKLMTEEQARALRVRRDQEELARREAEARRRNQLLVEGEEALRLLLADADFLAAPAAGQVAGWREFSSRYPYTPLPDHYLRALEQLEKELATQEQERRMAELEQRVEEGERRAAEAEAAVSFEPEYVYVSTPWWPSYCRTERPRHRDRYSGVSIKYSGKLISMEYNVPHRRRSGDCSPRRAPRPHPGVYTHGRVLTRANGTPFISFSLANNSRL
ncbi:MAG: hypothetical protein JXB04_01380 [Kiritimatiellae bacterium]|nr:hypothetical protein [Kiritimatiellia bacterium]